MSPLAPDLFGQDVEVKRSAVDDMIYRRARYLVRARVKLNLKVGIQHFIEEFQPGRERVIDGFERIKPPFHINEL